MIRIRTLSALLTASLVVTTGVAQTTPPAAPTRPAAPSRPATPPPNRGTDAVKQAGDDVKKAATDVATSKLNIVETAVAAGDFKTLAELLTAAGLVDALKGSGPFTVFAPTDSAFAKLGKETLAELAKPENKARLAAILKYHVVPALAKAADAAKLSFAQTLNGQRIDIKSTGGGLMIDRATVTKADIVASNGVIHVIDTVLMPTEGNILEVARGNGTFGILLSAIDGVGMTEMFQGPGPFTVLAPTDDAFRKLPKGTLENLLKPENKAQLAKILAAHVIPGRAVYSDEVVKLKEVTTVSGSPLKVVAENGKVTIGGATVVKADVETSNGVIHVIDAVILTETPAAKTAGAEATKQDQR